MANCSLLHLKTFGGSKRLLKGFLDAYGWEIGPDFPRRAMTMTLLHEFNALGGVEATVELKAMNSLDELAHLLWKLPERATRRLLSS